MQIKSRLSIRKIHALIKRNNFNLEELAINLNMSIFRLKVIMNALCQFEKTITYENFKALTVEEAERKFGDNYEEKWEVKFVNLNIYKIAEIHQAVRESKDSKQAVYNLVVQAAQFNNFLKKNILGAVFTYESFKALTLEKALEEYGDRFYANHASFKSKNALTVRQYHQSILKTQIIRATDSQKNTFIHQFKVNGKHLSEIEWRELSEREAEIKIGATVYNNVWIPQSIPLRTVKLSHFHKVLTKNSVLTTASKLGVSESTIRTLKLKSPTGVYTCASLKKLSILEAKEIFQENYDLLVKYSIEQIYDKEQTRLRKLNVPVKDSLSPSARNIDTTENPVASDNAVIDLEHTKAPNDDYSTFSDNDTLLDCSNDLTHSVLEKTLTPQPDPIAASYNAKKRMRV